MEEIFLILQLLEELGFHYESVGRKQLVLIKHSHETKTSINYRRCRFSWDLIYATGLSKKDYHVIGMDNLITGDLKNIEHLFKLEQFEFYHHDVTKFIHVPGQLDYILHFASPASPIDYLKIPIQTLKVGSLGTHNCLGLAKAKNAQDTGGIHQ